MNKKILTVFLLYLNNLLFSTNYDFKISNYSGRKLSNYPLFIPINTEKLPSAVLDLKTQTIYSYQKIKEGIFLLIDIEPFESKYFIFKENDIKFLEGTYISLSEPVGWESEIFGYRIYDGKIDLYGKKQPCFFIKLIKENKNIDIHQPTNPYGADILEKVAESIVGCGGLCYKEKDKFYNFGQPDKIEILEKGPILTSFKFSWGSGLEVKLTIFAKNRFTLVEILAKPDKEIYTGIKILDDEKIYKENNILASWGNQVGSPMKNIGQCIIIPNIEEKIKETIDLNGNHLIKVEKKYYILGGWEMEGIKNYNEWVNICKNFKEDLKSLVITTIRKDGKEEEIKKEEVKDFMKRLTQFVEKYHLKKDKSSQQYGMVYEYVNTEKIGELGQWIQGEGLDTMHDGAWFSASLCQAYRATGDKYYFDILNNYLISFYTNILNNSDVLFRDGLDEKKVVPVKNKFQISHRYLGNKGFCPYWWDDGSSISLDLTMNKGQRNLECVDYFILNNKENPENKLWGFSLGCSNHMAQDLAVMLIETYLLTKKEEILSSAKYLQEDRSQRKYPQIPVVLASTFKNENINKIGEGYVWYKSEIEPFGEYYESLYNSEEKQYVIPGFADDEEYYFYSNLIKHKGKFPESFVFRFIYKVYTNPFLFKYWYDISEIDNGLNRFDGSPISIKNGKFILYSSDLKGGMFFGSRMGPQNLKVIGWALQLLDSYPGIWENRYKEKYGGDILVNFKNSYIIDLKKEPWYSKIFTSENSTIHFGIDRYNFYIYGEIKQPLSFKIFSKPDGNGKWIKIDINKDIKIENKNGERIVFDYKMENNVFEIKTPFQICKHQKEFLTCVEHGRYSVEIDNKILNFYTMTSEKEIKEELLKELENGINTWKKIFEKKGYIPTGIGTSSNPVGRWEDFSDTGGYAHLIGACSQYLLFLEGKKYWQEIKIDEVF